MEPDPGSDAAAKPENDDEDDGLLFCSVDARIIKTGEIIDKQAKTVFVQFHRDIQYIYSIISYK